MLKNDQSEFSVDIPEDVKTMGYKDGMRPAIRHIGRWLEAFCGKLDKYSVKMEQENKAAVESIIEHYKSIPPEYRTQPKPRITYEAEQSFYKATDEPELQKLFVNLIKSCCDSRTAKGVLPSFVQILRQLTPDEAKMLRWLFLNKKLPFASPVIKVRSNDVDLGKGGFDASALITPLYRESNCEFPENGPIYLDNLQRLKLVDVDMMASFINANIYKEVESQKDIVDAVAKINSILGRKAEIVRGILTLTDFGRALCAACDIGNISPDN